MNEHIDHTLLKPWAVEKDIIRLCKEAREYKFRGVCVNPRYVELAVTELAQFDPIVVSVVDFPLGLSSVKREFAEEAIDLGAEELDVVWNLSDFKEGKYLKVMNTIHDIVKIDSEINIKVIVESCFLDEDEQRKAYQIVSDSGAQYIKTSTGMFGDCSLETIKLWRSLGDLKIKASGGIDTRSKAQAMIDAGADIIGTSHGVEIIEILELPEFPALKDVSIPLP